MTTAIAVPTAGKPRPMRAPTVADRRLRSGLRVLAVRKATVPKVEMQLVVPIGARSSSAAAERLLSKTVTSGTSDRSSADIAYELQRLGASLGVADSADHVVLSGSVLSTNFDAYLELLAEILTDASFPDGEVALERDRVIQEVQISRAQPTFVAQEALRRRLFGRHPYGVVQPDPSAVAKVGRASVRRVYADRLRPKGAVLVLVGDVRPEAALDAVERALGVWRGARAGAALQAPGPIRGGPTQVVDRPGSVQTNIRIAGHALPPGHEDSYALEVANTIFGGASMSRLMNNIREDKGYTYSPYSGLTQLQKAALFGVAAEVSTDVTSPAIVEIRYELGRMAALEVGVDELEGAQRFLTGIMSIRIQSQRGLAAQLARLAAFGLDVDYLKTYPRRILAVTRDQVLDIGRRYLSPRGLVTVLVGDASKIAPSVEAFDPVEIVPSR